MKYIYFVKLIIIFFLVITHGCSSIKFIKTKSPNQLNSHKKTIHSSLKSSRSSLLISQGNQKTHKRHQAHKKANFCPNLLSSKQIQRLEKILITQITLRSNNLVEPLINHSNSSSYPNQSKSSLLKPTSSWHIDTAIFIMTPHATYAWRWWTMRHAKVNHLPILESSHSLNKRCKTNFQWISSSPEVSGYHRWKGLEHWIQVVKQNSLSHQLSHPFTDSGQVIVLLHPLLFEQADLIISKGSPSIKAMLMSDQQISLLNHLFVHTGLIFKQKWGLGMTTKLPAQLNNSQAKQIKIQAHSPLAPLWLTPPAIFQWKLKRNTP
jgi:hypothetical protein